MRLHPDGCPCARCDGVRRYPDAAMCDWCSTTHNGDSYNCPEVTPEVEDFSEGETVQDEQLMWAVIGAIRAITKKVREDTMIPRSTVGQSRQNPQGQTRGAAAPRTGLPYLNQKNMFDYLELNIKYPARIVDCKVNPNATGNQSPVILKLSIKGKSCLWGLSTSNPSLETLTEMFGDDENNWADKQFSMWLHEDEFDQRIWPTVGELEGGEAKPSKKRS